MNMIPLGAIVQAVIWLIIAGIIVWLLWWALNRIDPPEPFKKVAEIVIVLGSVIVVIVILVSLATGTPVFRP
jgi:hypothetical protein